MMAFALHGLQDFVRVRWIKMNLDVCYFTATCAIRASNPFTSHLSSSFTLSLFLSFAYIHASINVKFHYGIQTIAATTSTILL